MNKKRKEQRLKPGAYLTLPSVGMLLCLMIVPLVMLIVFSFMNRNMFPGRPWPGWTLDNWIRLMEAEVFWQLLIKSLGMAALATVVVIIIAYPTAWCIAKYVKPERRTVFMMMVILPFFTSQLLLFYAMINLIQNNGILMTIFGNLGIQIESIMYSNKATMLLLIYAYVPYMILCLYSSLEGIDDYWLQASTVLGASPWKTFTNIIFPMSIPGLLSGVLLVFVPLTASFEVSELVGGSSGMMVGYLVNAQYKGNLNMGYGATLSCTLLVILSVIMAVISYITKRVQIRIGGEMDES